MLGAQLFNGVNGVSRGDPEPNYKEIQPRIGFAYQLGPNTVIRGGFGRFAQASFITAGAERLQPFHQPESTTRQLTGRTTTRWTIRSATAFWRPPARRSVR